MISIKLLQNYNLSEKTARIILVKIFIISIKALHYFKRKQFKCWLIIILSFYASRRLSLYRQHKNLRYDLNEITHFIPHGEKRGNAKKHILMWNPKNNDVDVSEDLKSINCDMTNCIFSSNRKFLPSLTDYDAVMFDIGGYSKIDGLPGERSKNQIYIMADYE